MERYKQITCCNKHATLSHYRDSLQRTVKDYVIRMKHEEYTVHNIIIATSDLVKELFEKFPLENCYLKACLVARVNYYRCTTEESVVYHHTSAPAEEVVEPVDFFERHMLRIGQRIDDLNKHGSMLMIKGIEAIHLQLSTFQRV